MPTLEITHDVFHAFDSALRAARTIIDSERADPIDIPRFAEVPSHRREASDWTERIRLNRTGRHGEAVCPGDHEASPDSRGSLR